VHTRQWQADHLACADVDAERWVCACWKEQGVGVGGGGEGGGGKGVVCTPLRPKAGTKHTTWTEAHHHHHHHQGTKPPTPSRTYCHLLVGPELDRVLQEDAAAKMPRVLRVIQAQLRHSLLDGLGGMGVRVV